jgi:hypothetical protein
MMTLIDQLTEHDRIELLARAQDAWDRAPQNTMRAVFEWRGENYVVSHSSFQLRIHSEENAGLSVTLGGPRPVDFPASGYSSQSRYLRRGNSWGC